MSGKGRTVLRRACSLCRIDSRTLERRTHRHQARGRSISDTAFAGSYAAGSAPSAPVVEADAEAPLFLVLRVLRREPLQQPLGALHDRRLGRRCACIEERPQRRRRAVLLRRQARSVSAVSQHGEPTANPWLRLVRPDVRGLRGPAATAPARSRSPRGSPASTAPSAASPPCSPGDEHTWQSRAAPSA